MPPKKRPTSQNTGHKAKRTRLSEMAEKRPEQVGQQDPPPQMMSVDIQALSSSISVAVKQAVQEALTGNSATLSTNVSVPHPEQLADGAIEASLANLSGQGTQPTQPTLTQETIIIDQSVRYPRAPQKLFSSVAVSLGSRVISKVKAKIWAHEFIDFGVLLSQSPNNPKYSLSLTSSVGESNQPQLTLEPNQPTKKIHTINQWHSAFNIFVAIYAEKFPQDTPKMMKYCEIVRDIAAKPGDWLFYDEQFRYIRQSAPDQFPWDVVHWELWLKAVTNFRPKSQSAISTNDKSSSRSRPRQFFPKGTCWNFHAGSTCNGCRFEHICYKCGSKHPATQCPAINQQRAILPKTGSTTTAKNLSQQAGHTRKS